MTQPLDPPLYLASCSGAGGAASYYFSADTDKEAAEHAKKRSFLFPRRPLRKLMKYAEVAPGQWSAVIDIPLTD